MAKKFEKLEEAVLGFVENKWLFPEGWGDTKIINEDMKFRSYFDDKRTYFDLDFTFEDYKISLMGRFGSFVVEHPLGMVVSENKLVELLTQVREYFSSNKDKEEQARIEKIHQIRSNITSQNKELRKLLKEGNQDGKIKSTK